jgi:hypothetical protein
VQPVADADVSDAMDGREFTRERERADRDPDRLHKASAPQAEEELPASQ